MAIKIGGTIVIDDNRNINAGIATFTELDVKPGPFYFQPTDNSSNVPLDSEIYIYFNRPVSANTGNITLRDGSASGTVLQTIGIGSTSVTISSGVVKIIPPNPLPGSTDVYVVVDADAVQTEGGSGNEIIDTYNFNTIEALGSSIEGGSLLCLSSGIKWIVAPQNTESSGTWYVRTNAVSNAQSITGCTGWFIPNCSQLRNPGFTCRTYWDSYCNWPYWSDTSNPYCPTSAFSKSIANGNEYNSFCNKTTPSCSRAFRCVTY